MSTLPSYEEATRKPTWITLVAPYISELRDLQALCLVSNSFREAFQPLIWHSPLETARKANLFSELSVSWWTSFATTHPAKWASNRARRLARILDTRYLSFCIRGSYTEDFELLQNSFDIVLEELPDLRCALIDGRDDAEKLKLNIGIDPNQGGETLRLLSWANSEFDMRRLRYWFFSDLIYLDISSSLADGSQCTIGTVKVGMLPRLRLLKVKDRKLEDNVAKHILAQFLYGQLWSLDFSRNKLTDQVIDDLVASFNSIDLREQPVGVHGPPLYDQQSEPRTPYLAHPPSYDAEEFPEDFHGRRKACRSTGVVPIKRNDLETMVHQLASDDARQLADILQAPRGLTHLDLSCNLFTAFGIKKLLMDNRGHLESLSCDYMTLVARPRSHASLWPRGAELYGVLDMADVLRPAFSVNLQELRIHHSLVTQIPTLEIYGWSPLAKLYFAETEILRRCEDAFREASFVPDTNPRLTSLTLTGIPWVSAGPLTDKLLSFIKKLGVQERDIQDLHGPPSRQRASVLRGLRHLTLEFDPSPRVSLEKDHNSFTSYELLISSERSFRFFDFGEKVSPNNHYVIEGDCEWSNELGGQESGSIQRPQEHEWEQAIILDSANQQSTVDVWLGPLGPAGSIARRYRNLVKHGNLRYNLSQATPAQVRAGAPEGAYIWQTAWHATMMPYSIEQPKRHKIMGMEDVIESIRAHRLAGRAEYEKKGFKISSDDEHLYWTGKLQVAYN